jgi:hypothetical protein
MTAIPESPETLLRRAQTAAALTEIEEGPVCVARDADYRMLGTFRKRADAVRAINAAVPSPVPSAVSAG